MARKPTAKPTKPPRGLKQGSAPHIWRWVAPPALRAAGWQSVTLKDRDGRHLSQGQALDACVAINAMIDAHTRDGITPAGPWAFIAPEHLRRPAARPVAAAGTIGALRDEWLQHRSVTKLAPTTQTTYASYTKRMIDGLAGWVILPDALGLEGPELARAEADYARDVAKVAQTRITALLPLQDDHGALEDAPPLQRLYDDILAAGRELETPMVHNAKAVITHARIFLKWVVKVKRKLPFNPAEAIETEKPKGRIVIWDADELDALLSAANDTGWRSINWAARLSRELSWQRIDILSLTIGAFKEAISYDESGRPRRRVRVDNARSKTGNRTITTLTRDGMALYDEIIAWHTARLGPNAVPSPHTPLLLVDDIDGLWQKGAAGKPWKMNYFTRRFADVRAEAEKRLGRPLPKFFMDLRDSAITEMNEAKLPQKHKISRSQHSPETADRMDHEHYGLVTPDISDEAADMIDLHRERVRRTAENKAKPCAT